MSPDRIQGELRRGHGLPASFHDGETGSQKVGAIISWSTGSIYVLLFDLALKGLVSKASISILCQISVKLQGPLTSFSNAEWTVGLPR
jgi:hypothetical protein